MEIKMNKILMSIVCLTIALWANTSYSKTERYTVKQGDSLSTIALQFYGNASKWTNVYRANKRLIKDSEKIDVGWNLIIPSIEYIQVTDTSTSHVAKNKGTIDSVIRLVTGNNYIVPERKRRFWT
jgi:LysM repeat protein